MILYVASPLRNTPPSLTKFHPLKQISVDTNILPPELTPSVARLLIHTSGQAATTGNGLITKVRRLLVLCSHGRFHSESFPLRLNIKDVRGFQVFALDDAGPLVDIPLPAGTYHVTAHIGGAQRGYTMTLDQGKSVDLYLHLAPNR